MLAFFGFAWRVLGLSSQSLWRDEIDAIYFALRELPATLAMFLTPGQNGALYFLGLRPWLQRVGSSEFALRYPSVLFGVVTIPLLWQVGRRLLPVDFVSSQTAKNRQNINDYRPLLTVWLQWLFSKPALLAALFLAINPYQLWYGQEGKMYTAVTFLALLAVWFWLEGIERGGIRPWLGLLVTISLGIYTHLLLILLLPLLLIWFIIAWPQSKKHRVGFFLVLLCLILPYAPMVIWQWDLLMVGEKLTALSFVPFFDMVEAVLHYQSQGIYITVNLLWLLPLVILGIYGLFPGPQISSGSQGNGLPALSYWRKQLLVVSWLIVPILSIYGVSLIQPIFLPRYIIWMSPAAMMIIALGGCRIWQQKRRILKGVAGIGLFYVIIFWFFIGWQQKQADIKPDLRNAVRYVSERRQPQELLMLQIPHLEFAYRYYSGDQGDDPFQGSEERLGRWVAGPWTNNEINDAEALELVSRELASKTEKASELWVIRSEEALWDARGFMGNWLAARGTLIAEKTYHKVHVQHYRLD